jgi:hypothetical protein
MSELKDLQSTFDTLRETIPPPTRMAKNRAAFLQHAKTVTENESGRLLGWSAPAFLTNGFRSGRHQPMSKRTIIALAAILTIAGTALAQQIIQFYTPNDDDRSAITLYYSDAVDGPVERFVSPPLEAVASTVPFTVKLPTFLPPGYRVEAAQYNEALHALDVIYSCEENPAYGFTLFQLSSGTELPPIDIGASALIETVQIGATSGELVRGGWSVVEPAERPEGVTSLEAEMVWDNEVPLFSLNWESEGMRYSMSNFIGSFDQWENPACLLDKNTGITIAESLTPYTS